MFNLPFKPIFPWHYQNPKPRFRTQVSGTRSFTSNRCVYYVILLETSKKISSQVDNHCGLMCIAVLLMCLCTMDFSVFFLYLNYVTNGFKSSTVILSFFGLWVGGQGKKYFKTNFVQRHPGIRTNKY